MVVVSDRAIWFFELILGQGIRGLAFWPFILVPTSTKIDDVLLNHERIHLRQQLEMLILPFYIWYLIALRRNGYMGISFEKEAYANETNLDYLKTRPMFAFLNYSNGFKRIKNRLKR
jgi:hypothetical protein